MRISDWSSDVCSSDLEPRHQRAAEHRYEDHRQNEHGGPAQAGRHRMPPVRPLDQVEGHPQQISQDQERHAEMDRKSVLADLCAISEAAGHHPPSDRTLHAAEKEEDDEMRHQPSRSEEHTSELQSLMRISYAVFC